MYFPLSLSAEVPLTLSRRPTLALIEEDELLSLLHNATERELDGLVDCLVSKGGLTCELKRLPVYEENYPHHRVYLRDIVAELQKYGANSLVSPFRNGKGVLYDEIVRDVAGRMGVSKRGTTAAIERRILSELGAKYWATASEEQRAALLENIGLHDSALVLLPVLPTAAITAVHASGFAAYQFTVIVANAVAHTFLGHGLSLATNAALTKGLSILAGPPGMCFAGLCLSFNIASPAYRVTIPAVVQVAMIRSAVDARRDLESRRKWAWHNIDKQVIVAIAAFVILLVIAWLLTQH